MRMLLLIVLAGCAGDAEKCFNALEALDADGDGALPSDTKLPASCTEFDSLEDAIGENFTLDDCDDEDPERFAANEEICGDGIDQDCDEEDPAKSWWYVDDDKDGFGDVNDAGVEECQAPEGTVADHTDCADDDDTTNPDQEPETECGPDVVDQNCDGVTDCNISGTISVDGATASFLELADGAGAAVAGEDGLVVVGGDNAAWTVTGDRQRNLYEESLDLEFEDGEEGGADVAILGGVVMVGAPGYDIPDGGSTLGDEAGRVYLSSGGTIDAAAGAAYVGRKIATGNGTMAVGRFAGDGAWTLYLVASDAFPSADETVTLSSEIGVPINGLAGAEDAPPAVSIAKSGANTLVAVGQPDSGEYQVKLWNSSDYDAPSLRIAASSSATFGSSILLMNVGGNATPDLIVGDSGQKKVYVFLDVSSSDTDLTITDADLTFSGNAAKTGATLLNAGDINGDGEDDLLIGAQNAAYLLLGGSFSGTLQAYASLQGASGSELAADIAAADLNDDGYNDLILGAPGDGGAYVLWGGP